MVMIRRGSITFHSVPVQQLFTFIRKKVLLGADEISGDGKSWVRVDRHYQLRKFFSNEDNGGNFLESEPNLSEENEKFEAHANLENQFQEVADLLKDINN
jgi:hypothetical protein|tara:strand:- start:337 stop:636 length:300 start_codon:yes stop_codon:yes gene_type:complete